MKAYLVPLHLGACAFFGDSEGYQLKGPILYVPGQGAIFYESSVTGDADKSGPVLVGVDFFESRPVFLEELERQIKGELKFPCTAKKFDLSLGVLEVDILDSDFKDIATEANTAYTALDRFREKSFSLISRLQEK